MYLFMIWHALVLERFTSNDYFPSIRIIFYILAPLGLDRAVLTFIIRKKSRLITDVRIRTGLISYAVGSSPELFCCITLSAVQMHYLFAHASPTNHS
jgi:hypothetical protein